MPDILLVPDAHGRPDYWTTIAEWKKGFIAIEYVLAELEEQLNAWIRGVTDDVTDQECAVFASVFAFNPNRDRSNPCAGLYTATVDHTRTIIKTLKLFDKIICLEMQTRPPFPMEDEVWAKIISARAVGAGVVVVGAQHVVQLRARLTIPNASYFSIYRDFASKSDVIRNFTPSATFPLLTKWSDPVCGAGLHR